MKRITVGCFLLVTSLIGDSALRADQIDLAAIVTKSDAETALGEPVRNRDHRTKGGKGDFYESECSYESTRSDKFLMLDLVTAPMNVVGAMFEAAGSLDQNTVKVEGVGDRTSFYQSSGMFMLNFLKGNTFVAIGIHGVPLQAALQQERAIARKILAHM